MVYRKNGYKPHYLDGFEKTPYKTWKQLAREQTKRDKKMLSPMNALSKPAFKEHSTRRGPSKGLKGVHARKSATMSLPQIPRSPSGRLFNETYETYSSDKDR